MAGDLFNLAYQFLVNVSFLMLAAMGLIIVLGMLNIINLAHGEFIMMGAYTATLSVHAGVPFVVAVVLATIVVGVIGAIVELLIVRRFYANKLNALVATFGLSLILSQGTLLLFGPYLRGVSMPLGGFRVGQFSYATYLLVVAGRGLRSHLCALASVLSNTPRHRYAGHDAESRHGASAWGQYQPYLHLQFRAWRGDWRG